MGQRSSYTWFHKLLHGFTLMELLVVISIVALLLSILLPSLSKAKQTAIRVECATRLRQLALFNFMYAENNNGRIPMVLFWIGFLFMNLEYGFMPFTQEGSYVSKKDMQYSSWPGVIILFQDLSHF